MKIYSIHTRKQNPKTGKTYKNTIGKMFEGRVEGEFEISLHMFPDTRFFVKEDIREENPELETN